MNFNFKPLQCKDLKYFTSESLSGNLANTVKFNSTMRKMFTKTEYSEFTDSL